MALVGTEYFISFTLQDQQGNLVIKDYETGATTEADAITIRDAWIAAYNNVGDAQIIRTRVGLQQDEDAPAFPVGSEVQEKATLSVQLNASPDKAPLTIPSPLNAIFVNAGVGPSGNTVDVANPQVLAFAGLFVNGATPAPIYISDGQTINSPVTTSVLSGRRVFRSRRRR